MRVTENLILNPKAENQTFYEFSGYSYVIEATRENFTTKELDQCKI